MMTTNDKQKRFSLRIDAKVFAEAEKRAKKNKRSIAKEIEYSLEKFYFNK